MAYYMRSNNASCHGNYMMSNSSMQGGYLMHSAKGSEWKKGHKYIDKRLIGGVWKYLYELPKEYLKNGREGAKKVAESADKDISAGYKATKQNVSNAAKDFKNYSKKVDAQKEAAGNYARENLKEKQKIKSNQEKNIETYRKEYANRSEQENKQIEGYRKAAEEARTARKEAEKAIKERDAHRAEVSKARENLEAAEQVYGKKSEQYRVAKEKYDEETAYQSELASKEDAAREASARADKKVKGYEAIAKRDLEKSNSLIDKNNDEANKLRSDYDRAEQKQKLGEEQYRKAEEEQKSLAYKASKALNALDNMIDDASGSAKQGAQWLKNQLEAGNKWAINTLANIEEKGSSALATGSAFLKNLFGKKTEAPSQSSSSSSGRNYSGTGNKAQKQGEAVAGGPVSNNDYRRRPKR